MQGSRPRLVDGLHSPKSVTTAVFRNLPYAFDSFGLTVVSTRGGYGHVRHRSEMSVIIPAQGRSVPRFIKHIWCVKLGAVARLEECSPSTRRESRNAFWRRGKRYGRLVYLQAFSSTQGSWMTHALTANFRAFPGIVPGFAHEYLPARPGKTSPSLNLALQPLRSGAAPASTPLSIYISLPLAPQRTPKTSSSSPLLGTGQRS